MVHPKRLGASGNLTIGIKEVERVKIPDYNKKIKHPTYLEMLEEIKRLKEEYMMLQNASDEVEEEKDKEIERLTAESTKWESKFYDEAKKVDRAIKYMEDNSKISLDDCVSIIKFYRELLSILKGSDKE